MTALEAEMRESNTHGIPWVPGEEGLNYVDLKLKDITFCIEKRPFYCDRGRYSFKPEVINQDKVFIDFADFFPRYFFSLQRGLDEINDWLEFQKLKENESTGTENV